MALKSTTYNSHPEIDIYYQVQSEELNINKEKSRHNRRKYSIAITEQKNEENSKHQVK